MRTWVLVFFRGHGRLEKTSSGGSEMKVSKIAPLNFSGCKKTFVRCLCQLKVPVSLRRQLGGSLYWGLYPGSLLGSDLQVWAKNST